MQAEVVQTSNFTRILDSKDKESILDLLLNQKAKQTAKPLFSFKTPLALKTEIESYLGLNQEQTLIGQFIQGNLQAVVGVTLNKEFSYFVIDGMAYTDNLSMQTCFDFTLRHTYQQKMLVGYFFVPLKKQNQFSFEFTPFLSAYELSVARVIPANSCSIYLKEYKEMGRRSYPFAGAFIELALKNELRILLLKDEHA